MCAFDVCIWCDTCVRAMLCVLCGVYNDVHVYFMTCVVCVVYVCVVMCVCVFVVMTCLL